jgi:hypothetical protein
MDIKMDNDNDNENQHISTFRLINETFDKMIDSTSIDVPESDQDIYDLIFESLNIVEKNNILFIKGYVGYRYDTNDINFIYDLNENKIYVASRYRLMHHPQEYDLYKNTYQVVYDKFWSYDENYNMEEKMLTQKYNPIEDDSVPYVRFPRTKDGISISRLVFNIFKVFRDEKGIKPTIIIPNYYNIYSQLVNES